MNIKRILITYFNNGDMKTTVAKEVIFNKITESLESEGKIYLHSDSSVIGQKVATFDDGTKVYMIPFGHAVVGMRFTHAYIHDSIMQVPNGENIVVSAYLPTIVQGEFANYDTNGQQRNLFSYENGELKITEFKGSK